MSHDTTQRVSYRTEQVGDVELFYRQAGRKDAPVLLLLHGFPSASHMFRDLMPLLASQYRLIAPDLPGFGMTKAPPRGQFDYTFDALYKVIEGFTEALGLTRYSLYLFDYGAPVGFRLAAAHPERVSAIVSQNGNAYLEGFSDQWDAWQAYWREPSAANREACRASLSAQTIREWQYGTGVAPGTLSPDGYTLDIAYMARPGAEEIQLDLILDYRSNVAAYPHFKRIFVSISRRCWPCGASTIPPLSRPARRPTARICQGPKCIYWRQGTSPWRRMRWRLRTTSVISCRGPSRRRHDAGRGRCRRGRCIAIVRRGPPAAA